MVHKRLHLILNLTVCVSLCALGNQLAFAQAVKSAQVNKTAVANSSGLTPDPVQVVEFEMVAEQLRADEPVVRLAGVDAGHRLEANNSHRLEAYATDRLDDYATLSGHQVACQAACCFPLAKLLEQRAVTLLLDAEKCRRNDEELAKLQASFLRRQAAWQRDVAAANALRAYYSWIANRRQLDIAAEALQFQQQQVAVQQALIDKGVSIADPTALERQRLELLDKQVQLQAADGQLASALLRLTCCASDLRSAVVEGLDIQPLPIDCDRLRTFALEHRQDYQALVQLCQCLTSETVQGVASMLTPLAGAGLNVPTLKMPSLNLLEKLSLAMHGDELLSQVRQELRLALQALRLRIEQDVCDKCAALHTAYERVEIAQAVIESWNQRIAALERLEQLGDARGAEMSLARSELLTARSTLVTRQLSAKLAEVDLAEDVGQLSQRCCQGVAWLVR